MCRFQVWARRLKINWLFSSIFMKITGCSRALHENLTSPQVVKKYPFILRNPKFHYNIHNSQPVLSILSQINPIRAPLPHIQLLKDPFLAAFAKFGKAFIIFVMSVCPHGTTQLPLDGFSWNLIFEVFFLKIYYENLSLIKIWPE